MKTGCPRLQDRKSTRLNSSHGSISYAVLCLKKNTHHGHQLAQAPDLLNYVVRIFEDDQPPAVNVFEEFIAEPRASLFCFNDATTTEIYTLSLHDALPI